MYTAAGETRTMEGFLQKPLQRSSWACERRDFFLCKFFRQLQNCLNFCTLAITAARRALLPVPHSPGASLSCRCWWRSRDRGCTTPAVAWGAPAPLIHRQEGSRVPLGCCKRGTGLSLQREGPEVALLLRDKGPSPSRKRHGGNQTVCLEITLATLITFYTAKLHLQWNGSFYPTWKFTFSVILLSSQVTGHSFSNFTPPGPAQHRCARTLQFFHKGLTQSACLTDKNSCLLEIEKPPMSAFLKCHHAKYNPQVACWHRAEAC